MKILPDAASITIGYLMAQADVLALSGGRVHGKIPDAPTFPLVTVSDLVGAEMRARDWFAGVPLDISAWAGLPEDGVDWDTAKAQAFDLIATVHSAMWLPAFHTVHAGKGVVSGVETRVGPFWNPDPNSDRPRYTMQLVVFGHPIPD